MSTLICSVPINSTSFGNVAINLLKEFFKKGIDVSLYPFGDQIQIEAFDRLSPDFVNWIKLASNQRHKNIDKNTPCFKLWHIAGSELSVGSNTFLYTFHETSYATDCEKRLLEFPKHVFFSSKYTQNVFDGISTPSSVIPLGFDTDFHKTDKKYHEEDIIHFGLTGKFENRKHTAKILKLWVKKYGNQQKFRLTTIIFNQFLSAEENSANLQITLDGEGKKQWNIQNFQKLKTNSEMNDYINSIDIELSGLSGGEGWGLPAFNATCLGKTCPVYNHTAHKEWATQENSILLEPKTKMPAYDGKFFVKGSSYSQGDFYEFDEDQVSEALDRAVEKAKTPNIEGEKLKETFSYSKMADTILETIFNR